MNSCSSVLLSHGFFTLNHSMVKKNDKNNKRTFAVVTIILSEWKIKIRKAAFTSLGIDP